MHTAVVYALLVLLICWWDKDKADENRYTGKDNMVLSYPQWLLFGDSITQHSFMAGGLGQTLANDYQRRLDVVNRGYGGYNTAWGLHVAPHVFPLSSSRQTLKAVNIWWGANDSTLPMRTQSIPLDEFKANLNKMIDMLRLESSPHYSPETVIILLSAPPMCTSQRKEDVERRLGPGIELDRDPERTKQFAYAVKEVAAERKLGFVNVYDALMKAAGPDPEQGLRKLLSDGLHLTPEGYQIVYQALMQVVQQDYPQLLIENVPRLFPDWSVIDPKDPGALFPKP